MDFTRRVRSKAIIRSFMSCVLVSLVEKKQSLGKNLALAFALHEANCLARQDFAVYFVKIASAKLFKRVYRSF